MRLLIRSPRLGTKRLLTAAVTAVAVAAVAAPLSMADPKPTSSVEQAGQADPDTLLRTPEVPRISDGSYSGFQFCGTGTGPLVSSGSPTLAATLESVAPPGSVESPDDVQPGRRVVFEVDTAEGQEVLRKQATSETSHDALYQVPEGKLSDGEFRWRTRVQDGAAVSEWTQWCDFTVRRAG
ncbi:hypothetical protein [Streptomyces atroolivaceus]|uniref:hypothetical protein n=1 Tax=Streptomyces atroolivaceus TaxID=66869 RepID=UPI0037A93721